MQNKSQSKLARRVLRDLHRQAMLHAGDRVGVAVSGGGDSVALVRLLEELGDPLGIRLAVVHFNHQLRGAESDADEKFVAALAEARHLQFFVEREDVAAAASRRGWNLEDAGRRLRHAYFASLLRDGTLTRIALAHTADDQAETVLARLIRGTGPAGLAAIYPTHFIQRALGQQATGAGPQRAPEKMQAALIRPLLGIRRSELRAYLKSLGQDWREDSSNTDARRLRARLRQQVLPLLEGELQPAIVPHLCRLAEMAREDEAFWAALAGERLSEIVRREEGRMAVRCRDLVSPMPFLAGEAPQEARLAVSRRLVRGLVELLQGDYRQLTAQHVERVLRLATVGSSGRSCDLPGVKVTRSFEWLWFLPAQGSSTKGSSAKGGRGRRATPGEGQREPAGAETGAEARTEKYCHSVELGRPGEATVVVIPEIRKRFRLKVIDWSGEPREDGGELEVGVLDRDLLHTPLVLRSWRPGDSLRPRGRQGTHKLKQFLRARRVAAWDRPNWPVLTSGGELAWVRGLPVAAKFAPRPGTRMGVRITEEEA